MTDNDIAPNKSRVALGFVAGLILVLTVPGYFDIRLSPALAMLDGDPASLGSVAGGFLGRQVSLAVLALVTVWWGIRPAVFIGALGLALFNIHDAVFLTVFDGRVVGATVAIMLAGMCLWVMWSLRDMLIGPPL